MAYRDDLAAAHARIEALERELAEARAEIERLYLAIETMHTGDEAARRERDRRDLEEADRRRLREKMEGEQREVEQAIARGELRARDDD